MFESLDRKTYASKQFLIYQSATKKTDLNIRKPILNAVLTCLADILRKKSSKYLKK